MPLIKSSTLLLACLAIGLASSAEASARTVKCLIASDGEPAFRGACKFLRDGRGGSFALLPVYPGARFASGVTSISVSIISPGRAEVRGLTPVGINSRWGSALRSKRDGACWRGDGFTICAW